NGQRLTQNLFAVTPEKKPQSASALLDEETKRINDDADALFNALMGKPTTSSSTTSEATSSSSISAEQEKARGGFAEMKIQWRVEEINRMTAQIRRATALRNRRARPGFPPSDVA